MRFFLIIILSCLFCSGFSQKDDLPFHIFLVKPKAKCISLDELSKLSRLGITDTSYPIHSYFVMLVGKDTLYRQNIGAEFETETRSIIQKVKQGDVLYIAEVRVLAGPIGKKSTRVLAEGITVTVGCKDE